MFNGIDVVRYTQMSRVLKVAEEYGKRLLRNVYGGSADGIAEALVAGYGPRLDQLRRTVKPEYPDAEPPLHSADQCVLEKSRVARLLNLNHDVLS
jgi:hypothetical protein